MEQTQSKKGLNISVRSFMTAIIVLLVLMILTYGLTFFIPGGQYQRIPTEDGEILGEFSSVKGGIPFWRWLLSPLLVLGFSGSGTLIAIIAFLLVVGGIFNAMEKGGLMQYMLGRIVARFGASRYRLLAVITLFFMAMGAFIGSYEECVPPVPLMVALAVRLGWDPLTGIGMSLLAAGCGFASGVCNPFTVGVAQELAGLPTFSGIWLRAVSFAAIYCLLFFFLRGHAKRVETPITQALSDHEQPNREMNRGLWCFLVILGCGILLVLSSGFITVLQDLTMVIVAAAFLLGGVVAVLASDMTPRTLLSHFFHGVVSILPAVVMILMASSIRFVMEEAHILDTVLHSAVGAAETLPRWAVILFIYLIVLILNFFINSGSAKAFLLIPIIVPLAAVFNIPPQLCVLAFAFGDGFSNVFFPTNPVLLISLGLAGISYGKWVRWSWKFQLANLAVTCLLLLFGLAVGYH